MFGPVHKVFTLVVLVVLLIAYGNANNSRPPRNNEISNMADALKYLQDLDAYYGDRARVRFGKRDPLIGEMHRGLFGEEIF